MSPLSKSWLSKTAYKINNKIIKNENRNNNAIFLLIYKNLITQKNLARFNYFFKFTSIKVMKKPIFITFNIEKTLNFLKKAFTQALIF